jgi:plastocyanin domain-containing protein
MDKMLVTAAGILLIGFIFWFFRGKKDDDLQASDHFEIKVKGGYKPGVIKILADRPAKLTFVRTDNNSCLEEVIFPDYKIRKFLPMNTPTEVTLPSPHPKNSGWHCAMNMFNGKITVV